MNSKPEIATVFNHNDWVKARAREIDLENEIRLAEEFDRAAKILLKSHKFAGISSNNIFWDLTKTPVKAIMVPGAKGSFVTLANPRILKLEGKEFGSVEACGSIPDNRNYVVKRKPCVLIGGYTLDRNYTELEYGERDFDAGGSLVMAFYHPNAWVVQHEMDHLDGITIKDKGTLFDYESLMFD